MRTFILIITILFAYSCAEKTPQPDLNLSEFEENILSNTDEHRKFVNQLNRDYSYNESTLVPDTLYGEPVWDLYVYSSVLELSFRHQNKDKNVLLNQARYFFSLNGYPMSIELMRKPLNPKTCKYQIGDTVSYKGGKPFEIKSVNPFSRCCCSYTRKGKPNEKMAEYALTKVHINKKDDWRNKGK